MGRKVRRRGQRAANTLDALGTDRRWIFEEQSRDTWCRLMSKDVRRCDLCVALRFTIRLQWQIGEDCVRVDVTRSRILAFTFTIQELKAINSFTTVKLHLKWCVVCIMCHQSPCILIFCSFITILKTVLPIKNQSIIQSWCISTSTDFRTDKRGKGSWEKLYGSLNWW